MLPMRRTLHFTLLALLMLVGQMSSSVAQNDVFTPAREWDGQSRFTVLVAGLDRRPAETTLAVRTDALMVVSIDPINRRLGVLNIPRDMHFALPDAPENLVRVNSLVLRGENRQEGYGLPYITETLQYNLGMYIDAYVAFDFVAFEAFIDALGGLPIDVPYTINDPLYPDMNDGYDPFYLRPGSYTFDGETALKYTRTRHGDNDYVRGQRQMDVVQAVIARLSDPMLVQTLVSNAPTLLADLNGHIYTNLAPEQIIYLGLSALQLDDNSFVRGSLDEDYSFSYVYQGSRIRVPDRNLLGNLLTTTFGYEYWR
jgi:LCP family protein required for cell wall assembly